MSLLSEIFNDSIMQSMVIGPIMGAIVSILFAGLTSTPTPREIEKSTSVKQTQNIYITNVFNQGNGHRSADNGEPLAIGLVLLGLALWGVWEYVVHAKLILGYIGIVLVTALSFGVFSIFCAWVNGHYTSNEWWLYTALPVCFLIASLFVFNEAATSFDFSLSEYATRFHFIKFFTEGLSPYGKKFMISHVLGVLALTASILLSLCALVHYLALMNQRANGRLNGLWLWLTRITLFCSGGGWIVAATIFLAIATVGVVPEFLTAWLPE